jgi:hypothetical protein
MPWIERGRTHAHKRWGHPFVMAGRKLHGSQYNTWQRRLRRPRADNDCRTRNAATAHHASGHYRLQANMSRHGASDSDSRRGSGLISNGLPQGTSRPVGIDLNSCSARRPWSVPRRRGFPSRERQQWLPTGTCLLARRKSAKAARLQGTVEARACTVPPSSRDSGSQERWIKVSLGRRRHLTGVDHGMSARRRW